MPANLRGITVDGLPDSLEGVRGRLQAILDGLGEGERVQQVLTWWKPDRLAEDGTVIEDGGPLAVVAITAAGSNMKAHVVALCNTRDTADAVMQYAQEFFYLKGRLVVAQERGGDELNKLAPWRLVVVRDGREEAHVAPAVAGVLPKLAEAVGRVAEEGGSVQAWLETPDGRVVFAGVANWNLAAPHPAAPLPLRCHSTAVAHCD